MKLDLTGLAHAGLGVSALGFGASVLESEKGTVRKKTLRCAYAQIWSVFSVRLR